jgi:hypothetical protein
MILKALAAPALAVIFMLGFGLHLKGDKPKAKVIRRFEPFIMQSFDYQKNMFNDGYYLEISTTVLVTKNYQPFTFTVNQVQFDDEL